MNSRNYNGENWYTDVEIISASWKVKLPQYNYYVMSRLPSKAVYSMGKGSAKKWNIVKLE